MTFVLSRRLGKITAADQKIPMIKDLKGSFEGLPKALPVSVVEDKKRVISFLVSSCCITEGHSISAGVHTPHPELNRDLRGWEILEIGSHEYLKPSGFQD